MAEIENQDEALQNNDLSQDQPQEVAALTEAETPQEEAPQDSKQYNQVDPDQFLKDFNWENYQEGIDALEDKQLAEFEKLVEANFVDTLTDEVVKATVNTYVRSRCYC